MASISLATGNVALYLFPFNTTPSCLPNREHQQYWHGNTYVAPEKNPTAQLDACDESKIMEQTIETGEMLTIREHGKSHAAANWTDKKAKRDSEPRMGCDMEEDIESEEDSDNELSKEYRQIQRHLVPKQGMGQTI
jgi:hypothetical protein